MELDLSKIVQISSQTENPIYNHYNETQRATCPSSENDATISNIEDIIIITDLDDTNPVEEQTETVIVPKQVECKGNIFDDTDIDYIESVEDLKKYLQDVLIRFDTSPKNYTKEDYGSLLRLIYKSLLHIYSDEAHDLVTQWNDVLRDDAVPSEKLVKETIDSLQSNIDEAIGNIQSDITTVQNTKQDVLIAGDGIDITNNVISNTRVSAEWGNVTGDIQQQTDLQELLSNKANISDIPNKTSDLVNDSGYITQHQDISNKEDKINKVTSISNTSTDIEYPSAKCVYEEFTTTITSDDAGSVDHVDVAIKSYIPVIDCTSDTATSFSIDPNKMYMFGTRTSLTIVLNQGEADIVNEYMFQFTSGNTVTSLAVPSNIVWLKDPDIKTNSKYLVSIENALGIIGEWSYE